MKLESIIILTTIFSLFLVSASINDIKPVICSSINLTEPNCTTWWDTLNLTDANLTTNVTINYITNITHNHINLTNYSHFNVTNITYTGNYSIYNITNNITHYEDYYNESNITNYYNKSEIDEKIPDVTDYVLKSEIDIKINETMQNSDLSYVIRTTNDIGTAWKVWLWIIGIIVLLLCGVVVFIIFGGMNG